MPNLSIIGGGKSCRQFLPKLPSCTTEIMYINNHGFGLKYPPNYTVWLDEKFFLDNTEALLTDWADGATLCTQRLAGYEKYAEKIETFSINKRPDLHDSQKLFIGNFALTGFFALSLACRFGYKRIYLFGYDFKSTGPDRLTYEDGRGNVSNWVSEFGYYRENYPDVKIYNVCPESKIQSFQKIDFDEFKRMVK